MQFNNENNDKSTINTSRPITKKIEKNLTNSIIIYKHSEISFAISLIDVTHINKFGIGWANQASFIQIIHNLEANKYIIDGNQRISLPEYQRFQNKLIDNQQNFSIPTIQTYPTLKTVIKADQIYLEVMLASIIAKVYRDQIMRDLNEVYPHYSWHTNSGYGTRQHIEALIKYGHTPIHRTQFINTALKNYLDK